MARMKMPQFKAKPLRLLSRDALLLLGGLAGVTHETVLTQEDRPTLLILFAAMMGLPAFLRTDEQSKKVDQSPTLPSPGGAAADGEDA